MDSCVPVPACVCESTRYIFTVWFEWRANTYMHTKAGQATTSTSTRKKRLFIWPQIVTFDWLSRLCVIVFVQWTCDQKLYLHFSMRKCFGWRIWSTVLCVLPPLPPLPLSHTHTTDRPFECLLLFFSLFLHLIILLVVFDIFLMCFVTFRAVVWVVISFCRLLIALTGDIRRSFYHKTRHSFNHICSVSFWFLFLFVSLFVWRMPLQYTTHFVHTFQWVP